MKGPNCQIYPYKQPPQTCSIQIMTALGKIFLSLLAISVSNSEPKTKRTSKIWFAPVTRVVNMLTKHLEETGTEEETGRRNPFYFKSFGLGKAVAMDPNDILQLYAHYI